MCSERVVLKRRERMTWATGEKVKLLKRMLTEQRKQEMMTKRRRRRREKRERRRGGRWRCC